MSYLIKTIDHTYIYTIIYIKDLVASRCQHSFRIFDYKYPHLSQDTVYSNPIWFPSFKLSQATPEELALSRTSTSPYEPTEPAQSPKAWVLISRVGMHGLDKHGLQNGRKILLINTLLHQPMLSGSTSLRHQLGTKVVSHHCPGEIKPNHELLIDI